MSIFLGFLVWVAPYSLTILLSIVFFTLFSLPIEERHKLIPHLLGCLISVELLNRISYGPSSLPWESGKYIGLFLLCYGIIHLPKYTNGKIGWIILLLSLPAVFKCIWVSDRWFKDLVFNFGGLLCLSLGIIYFSNYVVSKTQFLDILYSIFLSIIGVFTYIIISSTNPYSVEYALTSLYELSAGFNPNQVTTVLSIGFTIGLLILPEKKHMFFPLYILSLLMLTWSLLTFSRGGVLVGICTLLIIGLLSLNRINTLKVSQLSVPYIVLTIPTIIFAFLIANIISQGKLLDRYAGETGNIEAGLEEKSINTYTSYRWETIQSDWAIWVNNPILGVGVGQSIKQRSIYGKKNLISHTELTRLLSEHGILGLGIAFIIILSPIVSFFQKKKIPYRQLWCLVCFSLAIGHSMHSAMRSFTTPLFFGMAFIQFKD